jgi:hypothetical protein
MELVTSLSITTTRMMMTMLVEVFVPLAELAIHPEAPDTLVTSGEKDGPSTTVVNLDTMLVESRAKATVPNHEAV